MRKPSSLAVAVLVLLLPASAPAQQAEAWRDSAQHIHAAIRALQDSLLQGDSTAIEVARRGNLVIAASSYQRANAVDVLERLGRIRDRWFAGAMPADGGFRFIVTAENGPGNYRSGEARKSGIILTGLPDTGNSVRGQRMSSPSQMSDALIDGFGSMMIASVPRLTLWLQSPPPLSMPEEERRKRAMYAFVTGTGAAQRNCVAGQIDSCRIAMDIRRAAVAAPGPLFTTFLRTDLLYFALDAGGPGAWIRLRDAADSGVEAGLAAAAGIPIDSLLAHWRQGLLTLQPARSDSGTRVALVAITWCTVLLLGTLGASRWA